MKINAQVVSQNIGQLNKKELDRSLAKMAIDMEYEANSSLIGFLNISSTSQDIKSTNESVGVLQIADGTLKSLIKDTQKISELGVSYNSGTLNEQQKGQILGEVESIKDGMKKAIENSSFNRQNVFGEVEIFGDIKLNRPNVDTLSIEDASSFLDSLNEERSNIGSLYKKAQNIVDINTNKIYPTDDSYEKLDKTKLNPTSYVNSFDMEYLQRKVLSLLG